MKILLATLFFNICLIQCFQPTDLCFTKNNQCLNEYKYKCDTETCAKDKMNCEKYDSLTSLLTCSLCKILKSSMYETQMLKLIHFIRIIKECPINENKWTINDVCITATDCFKIKHAPYSFNNGIKIFKKVDCKCKGNYTYNCGRQYCSMDKDVCDSLSLTNTLNSKSKAILLGIKQCGNREISLN